METPVEKYNNTIREMIKHENEIRNQRTNWFLVIQGFLIAGICQLECKNPVLQLFIAVIGAATSVSFWHAAWRSTLAMDFALACWKKFLGNEDASKYPPVSLITKEILKVDNSTGNNPSWEAAIQKLMYSEKRCKLCRDKIRNRFDRILPYRVLPVLFFVFWILFIAIMIVHFSQK